MIARWLPDDCQMIASIHSFNKNLWDSKNIQRFGRNCATEAVGRLKSPGVVKRLGGRGSPNQLILFGDLVLCNCTQWMYWYFHLAPRLKDLFGIWTHFSSFSFQDFAAGCFFKTKPALWCARTPNGSPLPQLGSPGIAMLRRSHDFIDDWQNKHCPFGRSPGCYCFEIFWVSIYIYISIIKYHKLI